MHKILIVIKFIRDAAKTMALAIFDLDNTLITGDSDFLWGQFLVDRHIVDAKQYEEKNKQFFEAYEQGVLDIDRYLKFSLKPLTQHPVEQLYAWRSRFIETIIRPLIAPGARDLLNKHRSEGDTLLIISATHLFITQPIAELLDVPNILATEAEFKAGKYTGNYIGIPTYQQGKVNALKLWLKNHHMNLAGSTFYSDSHNDMALLEKVDHPIVVNADKKLLTVAREKQWPELNLRE